MKLFFYAPAAKAWWKEVVNDLVAEGFRPEVDAVIAEIEGQENPYESASESSKP